MYCPIVDAFTQWLIQKPEWYDVGVTTNMFGDIVTDLASVLQGGMGLAVGANVGETISLDVSSSMRTNAIGKFAAAGECYFEIYPC